MIGGRRPLRGTKPGDRRVKVERPHAEYFRYAAPGVLTAKAKASEARSRQGRLWAQVRRIVIGRPLASEEEIGERLPKKKALAIFSSDAISSSTYATEEILRVLVLAGATGLALVSIGMSVAIAFLLAVVATSYRQICFAYPSGGGAYAVSKANLNQPAALIAAAALLFDYIMTVAVSVVAGVAAIYSAVPELFAGRTVIAVTAIAIVTVGNLRGLRESGNIFAVPTYLFVIGALGIVGIGVVRIAIGDPAVTFEPREAITPPLGGFELLAPALFVRAFAAGSVALTGTEAISNGVPAFKPPESRNAAMTLGIMAALLGILFVGFTVVSDAFGVIPRPEGETVVSQLGRIAYGQTPLYYLFQAATALILLLAANTSYNGFPRLAEIVARDGYLPRQFAFVGDRLAFSFGIILLGAVSAALVVAFGGDTHALIPLYSVGIFASFTLSQTGMVRHWLRERSRGWPYRLGVHALGALMTAVVTVVVIVGKFVLGAWLVLVFVPSIVAMMWLIHRQYAAEERELALRPDQVIGPPRRRQRVVVPVPGISRAVVQAVNFGRTISPDVRAVHITNDLEEGQRLRCEWERQIPGVPLVLVESPYRELVRPFVRYLDVVDLDPEVITVVVLPEFVARHWWERFLHNQTAQRIRAALVGRPDTVVASVPYRREAAET